VGGDGGAVDGCWWASRQDSRWVGSAGWRGSAGGLGVPLTLQQDCKLDMIWAQYAM